MITFPTNELRFTLPYTLLHRKPEMRLCYDFMLLFVLARKFKSNNRTNTLISTIFEEINLGQVIRNTKSLLHTKDRYGLNITFCNYQIEG